jgi:hypothetical protein
VRLQLLAQLGGQRLHAASAAGHAHAGVRLVFALVACSGWTKRTSETRGSGSSGSR